MHWVAERSGSNDFADSAKGLLSSWSQRLKFNWRRDGGRTPDIDYQTALVYSNGMTIFNTAAEVSDVII